MTRFVTVLVVAGSFLLFARPVAKAQPEEGQYYLIKNVNSKKALSVEAKGKEEGAKIVQVVPGGAELQQWKFVKNGDFYNIINRKTGRALNVQNESKEEGTPIIQWDAKDNNYENQQWSLEKKGKHFVIKARHSGMVLDVAEGSKDRKAPLIQWPFNEGRNQIFELEPAKK